MYNNHINTRSGFIPLIIGGVIGYGIGSSNRPNYYYPVYPMPIPYFYNMRPTPCNFYRNTYIK